jgi:hypothetical protein
VWFSLSSVILPYLKDKTVHKAIITRLLMSAGVPRCNLPDNSSLRDGRETREGGDSVFFN